MKNRLMIAVASLVSLTCLPATAQPGPGMGGMRGMDSGMTPASPPRARAQLDCSKAPNPARCEQHQKAHATCQEKLGPEHKACLRQQFNTQ